MYRNFFSLSDLPFSIAPNPKYLYMSDRHKEALSHLTYGLGEAGGFALLTGEVGTGKTTVSRCLMDQLPDNTQALFILNPMLSSLELLATIFDKLELESQDENISLKNLTDNIAERLLENHKNGINTLLIIDEAQHLQPEVLEQLRLLTNLETDTKKLLQVILIGQPELQQLLQRRDLRQLAQRITARYHLMPLTKAELQHYIQHRLHIADCSREIFNKAAISKIYALTEGVPRLTNLLCHSALMLAYNNNDSVVNKKTVVMAAELVLGVTPDKKQGNVNFKSPLLLSAIFSATAFITLAAFWWGQSQEPVQPIVNNTNNLAQDQSTKIIEPVKNDDLVVNDDKYVNDNQITHTSKESTAIRNDYVIPKISAPTFSPPATSPVSTTGETLRLATSIAPDYALHTVRYGDNLYNISVRYNLNIETLREWNYLPDGDNISVGDKLFINNPEIFSQPSTRADRSFDDAPTNAYREDDMLVVSGERQSQTTSKQTINSQVDAYNIEQVDGVSDDLLARFQAAIDETEGITQVDPAPRPVKFEGQSVEVQSVSDLPHSLQNALPKMQFEQHIYASDGEGWVTVNSRDRYEGDYINNDLRVEQILPQQVILSFRGEQFSMPALTNW